MPWIVQIIASAGNGDLRLAAVLLRNWDSANGTSSTLLVMSSTKDAPGQEKELRPVCLKCKSAARSLSIGRRHNLPALESKGEARSSIMTQQADLVSEVRAMPLEIFRDKAEVIFLMLWIDLGVIPMSSRDDPQ